MGADIIEPIVDAAAGIGVRAISLYAFSTENWIRPDAEVRGLWDLLDLYFFMKLPVMKEKGVRIRHSGSLRGLPPRTKKTIAAAQEETKNNTGICLNFCINYGGRQEIVHAVNRWLDNRRGAAPLKGSDIERNLYTAGLPPVDLMIRTSGEYRISNFLLWQLAYAEMVFLDVLWPEFKAAHLYRSIYMYQNRERRYGGI